MAVAIEGRRSAGVRRHHEHLNTPPLLFEKPQKSRKK
jgi:hypothetical protein